MLACVVWFAWSAASFLTILFFLSPLLIPFPLTRTTRSLLMQVVIRLREGAASVALPGRSDYSDN